MNKKIKVYLASITILTVAAIWLVIQDYNDLVNIEEKGGKNAAFDNGSLVGVSSDISEETDSDRLKECEDVQKLGHKTCYIRGRLIDTERQPVVGVCIHQGYADKLTGSFWFGTKVQDWIDTKETSDKDGRFSVLLPRHLTALSYLKFCHPEYRVIKIGLHKAIHQYDGSMSLGDIFMSIDEGYYIKGRVVNRNNEPLPNCRIIKSNNCYSRYWHKEEKYIATTDEDGRFLMKLTYSYKRRATAFHENYGIGWSEEVIPGRGKEVPEVKIVLSRGGTIEGKLLYSDEAPADFKKVGISGDINGFKISITQKTDEKGCFEFSNLPDGVYSIHAITNGFREDPSKFKRIPLTDNAAPGDKGLVFYIPTVSRLIIHLKDIDELPVLCKPEVDYYQSVSYEGSSYMSGGQWVEDMEDIGPGVFGLKNIQPGKFNMTFKVDGYAPCKINDVVVKKPPEETNLTVLLAPVRSIRGKVLFHDGRPAPGISVRLEKSRKKNIDDDGSRITFTDKGLRMRKGHEQGEVTVTNGDGMFSFDDLDAGEFHLYLVRYGMEILEKSPISLNDDHPAIDLEIKLPVLSGSIAGKVLDASRAPIPKALVIAWDGANLFCKTSADKLGRYIFKDLPNGYYKVDARSGSYAYYKDTRHSSMTTGTSGNSKDNQIFLDEFNAQIVNGKECRLDLVIADPWNSSVSGCLISGLYPLPKGIQVSLGRSRDQSSGGATGDPAVSDLFYYSAGSDKDKSAKAYRFENVCVGKHTLTASWNVGDNQCCYIRDSIVIEPSMHYELNLQISTGHIEGEVKDKSTGKPLSEARICMLSASGAWALRSKADKSGQFNLKNAPTGIYDLIIYHSSYRPSLKRNLEISENESTTGLVFELESGLSISGRINVEGGLGYDKYWQVKADRPPLGTSWPSLIGYVYKDGGFSIKGLPPGEIKLVITCSNERMAEKTVVLPLKEGEELVIDVPLR